MFILGGENVSGDQRMFSISPKRHLRERHLSVLFCFPIFRDRPKKVLLNPPKVLSNPSNGSI